MQGDDEGSSDDEDVGLRDVDAEAFGCLNDDINGGDERSVGMDDESMIDERWSHISRVWPCAFGIQHAFCSV